jgi:hypothetical protein
MPSFVEIWQKTICQPLPNITEDLDILQARLRSEHDPLITRATSQLHQYYEGSLSELKFCISHT